MHDPVSPTEQFQRPSPDGVFLLIAGNASVHLLKRVRSSTGPTVTLSRDELLELSLAFIRSVAMAERAHLAAAMKP